MTKRDYRLFNWKLDDDTSKRHVYNWYGEELEDNELNKLRIGDCVRLMLIGTEGKEMGSWEKIYFEIVNINYYKKGSINIPRTYFGKAMNTYRVFPEEQLNFVHTGDIISFQKNNVIEIPRWTDEEQNPLKEQPNADKYSISICK
ncbi:unnamed protein product [Cunninghamella echinulata]